MSPAGKAQVRGDLLLAGFALVVVVLATACPGRGGAGGDAQGATSGGAAAPGSSGPAAPGAGGSEADTDEPFQPTPLARNTVEVYFPAVAGDGLIGEYREIFETTAPGDRIKQIVNDLITGPSHPDALRALPRGTQLRQAYVVEDGTVYLDFTADLREGLGGGSMEELLTVYAVVDSVVRNVSEIRCVGILVEGSPIETLNGHMDLSRPLRPDFSLILRVDVVDQPGGAAAVLASSADD